MPFTLFRDRFQDLADRELRTITQLREDADIPVGQYAFVEMFCDEPGCDCRRVLLRVTDVDGGRCEATLNFGWEEPAFYAAWLREDDPELVAELKGPALHFGGEQGPHADAILEVAKDVLFRDAVYVERIRRHYEMFREDVEGSHKRAGTAVRSGPKVGRNDPCPCGSGRKFKKCCAQTAGAANSEA